MPNKSPYLPKDIEESIYHEWEQTGVFSPSDKVNTFSLMIPPPNVTGTLHMGHGFQNAIMDCLVRFKKMQGYSTLWQVGTDHAGIATEMVVERLLAKEGISKTNLGRKKFIEKVWDWKHQSGDTITQQLRRLGGSLDWENERFTCDDKYTEAVQHAFIELFDAGLIYQGYRLVNWDPKLQTSLSDLEVINEERDGKIWTIRYAIENSDTYVEVATTRPETLFGDMALAVNPEDSRYSHVIGKRAIIPTANRSVPIIEDSYVDSAFGTGVVKITPGHDFHDYEVGQRHGLHLNDSGEAMTGETSMFLPISIMDKNACLHGEIPNEFKGLERFQARKLLLEKLGSMKMLVAEKDHRINIPIGDRTNEILEPLLTKQWYVDAKTLALPAIKAVKNNEIKFVPQNWEKTYFQWMDNIQDWCISRQLWWGHRIPIWFDENENAYAGTSESHVRQKYRIDGALRQEEDVLDTWFSSSLWTFATLGWPKKTERLELFHPTSTLVTGFDIIFFWVARMIMMTIYFMKEIPFKEIFITGLIRDENGQKMSKSKGNILDPIDLIDGITLEKLIEKRTFGLMQPQLEEKIIAATRKQFPNGIDSYGTDALRFTFYSLAAPGRDINFDIGRIGGFKNFCNKLWNAMHFIDFQIEKHDFEWNLEANAFMHPLNSWMHKQIIEASQLIEDHIRNYRFDLASVTLYELVWSKYCDWYIELSKNLLTEAQKEQEKLLITGLIVNLEDIVKLAHPFMPFITEKIHRKLRAIQGKDQTVFLVNTSMPSLREPVIKDNGFINDAIQIISSIRTIRSELELDNQISLALNVPQDISNETLKDMNALKAPLARMCGVENLIQQELDQSTHAINLLISGVKYQLIFPDNFNFDKIVESLRDKKIKIVEQIDLIESKLNNQNFITKAPQDVVTNQQQKLIQLKKENQYLEESINKYS
jgi:valyl-tRNA synthetase